MGVSFLGVYGHVILDYIANLEALPAPNTSVQILDRQRFFGGTGGNIARISAHLGVRTALASFVGEDFPPEYREALATGGVDLTDLRVVPGISTPTAWIFTDRRGNQIAIVDQGPMASTASRPVQAEATPFSATPSQRSAPVGRGDASTSGVTLDAGATAAGAGPRGAKRAGGGVSRSTRIPSTERSFQMTKTASAAKTIRLGSKRSPEAGIGNSRINLSSAIMSLRTCHESRGGRIAAGGERRKDRMIR